MHVGLALIAPGIMVLKPLLPMPGEMLEPLGDHSKGDDPGIDPTLPIDDDPGNVDPTLPITDDPGIDDPTLPITDDPGIEDPTLPIQDDPTPGLLNMGVPGPGAIPNMRPELPNGPGAWLNARPTPGLGPYVPSVPKGAAKLRGEAASSAAATADKMYLRLTMMGLLQQLTLNRNGSSPAPRAEEFPLKCSR